MPASIISAPGCRQYSVRQRIQAVKAEAGTDDITMEYIEGKTLDRSIRPVAVDFFRRIENCAPAISDV